MKTWLTIIVAVAALSACDKKKIEQLELTVATRDNTINTLKEDLRKERQFQANSNRLLRQINSALKLISSSHAIISESSKDGLARPASYPMGQKMFDDLVRIDTYIEESKKVLDSLAFYKNQSSDLTSIVSDLDSIIKTKEKENVFLKREISDHLVTIRNLKVNIAGKTDTIKAQEGEIKKGKEVIDEKEKKIRELEMCYYVVGKEKELIKKGIIHKEGNLLGGALVLTSPIDDSLFDTVSVHAKYIDISGQAERVVPQRNDVLYRLRTDKTGSTLIIRNEDFWKPNYVAIIVK